MENKAQHTTTSGSASCPPRDETYVPWVDEYVNLETYNNYAVTRVLAGDHNRLMHSLHGNIAWLAVAAAALAALLYPRPANKAAATVGNAAGWAAAQALAHNAAMHALNGNIAVANTTACEPAPAVDCLPHDEAYALWGVSYALSVLNMAWSAVQAAQHNRLMHALNGNLHSAVHIATASVTSQHVIMYTAAGAETHTLQVDITNDIYSSVDTTSGIQVVPAAGSNQAVVLNGVQSSQFVWIVADNNNANTAVVAVHSGIVTVTLAAGDKIVFSSISSATTINAGAGGSINTYTGSGGGSGVQQVNVVGFSELEVPLWTSSVNPSAPPIVPPPLAGAKVEYRALGTSTATEPQPRRKRLTDPPPRPLDPKGHLNFLSTHMEIPLASYTAEERADRREGPDRFRVVADFAGRKAFAFGSSRKEAEVNAASNWVRDLTADGDVESNPGPTFNADAAVFVPRHPFESDMGAPGRGHPYGEARHQNPFKLLDPDTLNDELQSAAWEMSPAVREWMLEIIDPGHEYQPESNVAKLNAELADEGTRPSYVPVKAVATPRPAGGPGARSVKADEEQDAKRSRLDLRRQAQNVTKRLVAKFSSFSDFIDWVVASDNPPSADLVELVFTEIVKTNRFPATGDAAYVAEGIAKRRPRRSIWNGLSFYNARLAALAESDVYNVWLDQALPTGGIPRADQPEVKIYGGFNDYGNEQIDGYAAYLQATCNKRAHSLNGNTSSWAFPNSMDEIKSAKNLRPLLEADGQVAGSELDPVEEVAEQTGLLGPQGVTMSSVPRELALRGATISAANAVTLLNDLNSPEALLYPLQVRNGAGAALVNQANRPPLFGIGLVRRQSVTTLSETPEGMSIRELVSRTGNIRPDQVTVNGFYTRDLAALLRVQPGHNGDTIQAPLLKMMLYNLSRAWIQDPAFLPLGGEPGKFDAFTQLDANPAVTVGYDNAALFGADCGTTVAPVFPYVNAGVAPTIAFHVTIATVPANEPYIFMHPGLLLQNDRGFEALNIALLALMFAPYPCGIHSVAIDTLDDAGGNAAAQTFIPHSDLVHIPGLSTLHIILPTDSAGSPPANQASANDAVLLRPTAGPTNAGALVANAALDVSFVDPAGAGLTTYDLASYLVSWMALPNSPIDTTTITRFYKQFAQLTRRTQDIRYVWDLACTLTARYPAMFEAVVATPTRPAANSAASVAQQNFFALAPHLMTADYPEEQEAYDLVLPSTNPLWVSKILSGAYEAGDDMGPASTTNYSWDASPRMLQYAVHTVRQYAVTAEYVFAYFQQSREVWNNAFTQQNYVGILDQIRELFTRASPSNPASAMVSEAGYAVALLHSRVTGHAPPKDMFGHYLWEKLNSPRVGFQAVWSAAGAALEAPTPSVLADIWVQLNSQDNTMAFTPMLSTNKMLTGVHLDDGQVTPLGAGSYTVPLTIETQPREVGLDTIPLLDDRMLFNARLVWHTFNANLYTLDGVLYNVSTVASGNVVAQKSVVGDWTLNAILTPSVLTAKTTWFPFMTPIGLRLAVGVTAVNGANLMTQIMASKTTTGVATWLIRNARAMPNTIVDGGGRNKTSRLARRNKPENSSPSSEAAASAGEEPQTETS